MSAEPEIRACRRAQPAESQRRVGRSGRPAAARLAALAAVLFVAAGPGWAEAPIFYLNGMDPTTGSQQIFRYPSDGKASPAQPVIGPTNNGNARHLAWPSAFKLANGKTRVYASRFYDGRWQDLAYWETDDGREYRFGGIALAADATEPHGIGPTQVYIDASSDRPFLMVYLVRNNAETGNVLRLATSRDGLDWIREGTVLEGSEPWEAAGLTPSYVANASDGTWVLFYQGYQTLMFGPAAIATSPSAKGPFTNKRIIFPPNSERLAITDARATTLVGRVQGRVRPGEPYVLRSQAGTEPITPIRQDGEIVIFDRPLLRDYAPGEMTHIAAAKVEASYVLETPTGWRGIFTGYGHYEGLQTEYTFTASAPTYAGPWRVEPSGLAFQPWLPENTGSLENPTPLVDATQLRPW
jgi:hypothetical protein